MIQYPEGATPLAEEELQGLIPGHIVTRGELDAWEALNIDRAHRWLNRMKLRDVLSEPFVRLLHKKMFDETWTWAGQYRTSEKNLGVKVWQIQDEVPKLCGDARYWIEQRTFPPDEIAVRFHHKLVWVHPFPNGNGRHARLMADLLAKRLLGRPAFSWGGGSLEKAGEIRKTYLNALHEADHREFGALLSFARS
ncbi:MAG: cell filamentation protein Fic [Planctomycetes bacterium RBG_13_60_9]|nr:MAG: cell filamentation protein Fic [Planctomycetes bacterium RBG_13_60_9]